jgi:hypothetical protein
MQYPQCKTTVQAPSQWDTAEMRRSARLPKESLKLERVYGHRCDHHSHNVRFTHRGDVVYYAAATAVVLRPGGRAGSGRQQFFRGHTDDISCLTVDPSGEYCATGQIGRKPFVCVWHVDSREQVAEIGSVPTPEQGPAAPFISSQVGGGGAGGSCVGGCVL